MPLASLDLWSIRHLLLARLGNCAAPDIDIRSRLSEAQTGTQGVWLHRLKGLLGLQHPVEAPVRNGICTFVVTTSNDNVEHKYDPKQTSEIIHHEAPPSQRSSLAKPGKVRGTSLCGLEMLIIPLFTWFRGQGLVNAVRVVQPSR